MKVSYNWLKEYFDVELPSPRELARIITLHSYEVEDVFERDGDFILDIDVLPNRSADSLSHDGIAKEVGAVLGLKPIFKIDKTEGNKDVSTEEHVSLQVENIFLVRRATKRLVVDVRVGESPGWLKTKLSALGQRSINNVVDVTNLVMLETGQPVHAFDFDKIAGDGKKDIFIRESKEGEFLEALDGMRYDLPEGSLVIADTEKPLDIAGVKGGLFSGIDENTTKVLLSACNFDPVRIRRTSRNLALLTDASKRFEQGLSPNLVTRGMERLSILMAEVTDAKVAKDFIDIYPRPTLPYQTGVSLEEINGTLGTMLSEKEVSDIFNRLGFSHSFIDPKKEVVSITKELLGKDYKYGSSLTFDAPQCFDCSSLSSYVFSRLGYSIPRVAVDQFVYAEKVEATDLREGDLIFSTNGSGDSKKEFTKADTGQVAEIDRVKTKTVSFLPGTEVERGVSHCGIYSGEGKVIHASSKEGARKVVEEDLKESTSFKDIVGYGRVIRDDIRFVVSIPPERTDIKREIDLVEEVGRLYGYDKIVPKLPSEGFPRDVENKFYWSNKVRDILVEEGFSEVMTYVLRDVGEVELENPLASDKSHLRDSLAYGLRDVIDRSEKHKALLESGSVDIFEIGKVFFSESEKLYLGIASDDEDRVIEVRDKLQGQLKIEIQSEIEKGLLEIDLETLIDNLPPVSSYDDLSDLSGKLISYKPASPYPYVLRDIAVWVPADVESNELLDLIKRSAGDLLVKANLFDEYKKEDKVSYAHSLIFQSAEKTLSDEEVNEIMSKVEDVLTDKGFEVR